MRGSWLRGRQRVATSQSEPVQGVDKPSVFDVGLALSGPDIAVTKCPAHEEKVTGCVVEQGGERMS